MDKLSELKQSWAKMDKKFKEIQADMPMDTKNNDLMNYMWDAMSSMRNMVWDLHDSHAAKMNDHMTPPGKTHAPHLNCASAVESYLDACGMSEDYAVQKPTIQVRANSQGNKTFEVDLNIK